jgi:cell filamentation protein
VSDPYLIPGGSCLANKLGITDADELSEVEARIVSIRGVELARETLPGEYNLAHLQAFHQALFGDMYEWAGRTRTVNISKENSLFCAVASMPLPHTVPPDFHRRATATAPL